MGKTFKVKAPEMKRNFLKLVEVPDLLDLGTPVVADDDRIVTSTNMKVGSYTKAANPDVPRNITVTVTGVTGADTMGTITVTGTDINGATISEVISPVADSTVAGAKAFKTVSSIVGAGWVINTGNDTIKVGVGNLLGLPIKLEAATDIRLGVLGTALVVPAVVAGGTVEGSTVDLSSGTYDGSKRALVFVKNN